MGASSRSPSPMTMVPSMGTVSITRRMALTATPSLLGASPWPMVLADSTAASSTTRTNSRASSTSMPCDFSGAVVAMVESPLESVYAGDVRADDEGVNVMCALVSLHRFQVHHVAHDGVIVRHTVGAENVTRHARAFQRHPHIVPLEHGDVLVGNGLLVLHSPHLQGQKLGLADLGDHPYQLLLHELVRCNGLVAELLAQDGILQRGVVAGHGRADGAPADPIARLVEAHQRRLEPAGLGKQVACRHAHVLQ